MCTIAEGRRSHSVSAKAKSNACFAGEHTPVMTVSCSDTQMQSMYEYEKKPLQPTKYLNKGLKHIQQIEKGFAIS